MIIMMIIIYSLMHCTSGPEVMPLFHHLTFYRKLSWLFALRWKADIDTDQSICSFIGRSIWNTFFHPLWWVYRTVKMLAIHSVSLLLITLPLMMSELYYWNGIFLTLLLHDYYLTVSSLHNPRDKPELNPTSDSFNLYSVKSKERTEPDETLLLPRKSML